MTGPFETEAEARAAVRGIYSSPGTLLGGSLRLLEDACAGSSWAPMTTGSCCGSPGWEPQMCAVVAGIISPAAAGPPAVSDVIIGALRDAIAYRESGTAAIGCRACGDRYTGPRCGEHAEDSPRVLGYRRALQP